jgi:gamma-glutamylcyclotransferase (GGCT)/AIG2-like uncharacterized protein YtfP
MRVFVYGTLRRGQGNYPVMQRAGGEFVRDAVIKGKVYRTMLPFLVPGNEDVPGEVFEVPPEGIPVLDYLEGHPDFYQRRPTQTTDGEEVIAYFLNDPGYIERLKETQGA